MTWFCPKCGHELTTERHREVTIDICTACKGVWLDQGELARLIAAVPPGARAARARDDRPRPRDDRPRDDRYDDRDRGDRDRPRPTLWSRLGDLLD